MIFLWWYTILSKKGEKYFSKMSWDKSLHLSFQVKRTPYFHICCQLRERKSFRPKLPSHELSISVSENYTFILASKLLLCHLSVQPSREREKYILSFLNLEYYSDYPGIRIKTYPLVSTLQFWFLFFLNHVPSGYRWSWPSFELSSLLSLNCHGILGKQWTGFLCRFHILNSEFSFT